MKVGGVCGDMLVRGVLLEVGAVTGRDLQHRAVGEQHACFVLLHGIQPGIFKHYEIRPAAHSINRSGASGSPPSNIVAVTAAKRPPAEKPIVPMRSAPMPNSWYETS